MVIYAALLQPQVSGSPFRYAPDAPWWIALQCFIAQWLTESIYRRMARDEGESALAVYLHARIFALSSLVYVCANSAFFLFVEYLIGFQTIDAKHALTTVILSFINHCVVGGLTLAYRMLQRQQAKQLQLLESQTRMEKLVAESRIDSLQKQIDPHFLFNNLNVLSALIQRNPDAADEFLNAFAEIYRYTLDTQSEKLVPLDGEIRVAMDYMHLLEQRYNGGYRLQLEGDTDYTGKQLVPFGLQMLLENAAKHNVGDAGDPLTIRIEVGEGDLTVSNLIRRKQFGMASMGIGLQNLKRRYEAITGKQIEIEETESRFSVRLPLIAVRELQEVSA
jgi:sensor histidine kinase YesM